MDRKGFDILITFLILSYNRDIGKKVIECEKEEFDAALAREQRERRERVTDELTNTLIMDTLLQETFSLSQQVIELVFFHHCLTTHNR